MDGQNARCILVKTKKQKRKVAKRKARPFIIFDAYGKMVVIGHGNGLVTYLDESFAAL